MGKKRWVVVSKVRENCNMAAHVPSAGFQGNTGCNKMKFSDFLASRGAFVVCGRFSSRDRRSKLCKQRNLPMRWEIPHFYRLITTQRHCRSTAIHINTDLLVFSSDRDRVDFPALYLKSKINKKESSIKTERWPLMLNKVSHTVTHFQAKIHQLSVTWNLSLY